MRGCLLFVCLTVSWPGTAAETVLRTAASAGLAPWSMLASDGELTGIMQDIRERIARDAGVRFEIESLPVPRINEYATQGKLDAFFYPQLPVVDVCCVNVGPVHRLEYVVLPVDAPPLETREAAEAAPICALNRSPVKVPNAEVLKVRSIQQCFRLATTGRVSYIFGPRTVLRYFQAQDEVGASGVRFGTPFTLHDVQISFYVAGHVEPGIRERIRAALGAIDVPEIVSGYVGSTD